jgi:hypothetical protein
VFYEAGIAHTLGRDAILITQSEHDIPFDLRHLRYVKYLNNAEGRAALTQALQSRMCHETSSARWSRYSEVGVSTPCCGCSRQNRLQKNTLT